MGYDIELVDTTTNKSTNIQWISYNVSCHKKYMDLNNLHNKPIGEAIELIKDAIKMMQVNIPDVTYIEYASRYSKHTDDFYSILYDLYKILVVNEHENDKYIVYVD